MAIGSLYRCFLEAARELGVDTARLLEDELSLTEDALLAPEARLAPELGRKLLVGLVREAGDPELGLQAAERVQLADLDVFGYLLWHSSDLCSLFEALVTYAPLLGDTAAGTFERSKSALTIRIGRSGGRFFVSEGGDFAIGAAARLVREWSSGQAQLREAHLVRGRPRDERRYRQFFGAPLHFGAPVGSLVYENPKAPIVRAEADARLAAILRRQADHTLASLGLGGSLVERTRAHLGGDLDLGTMAASRVATRLGVSERTMRRHLTKAGTSYRALVDDSRRERALMLAHEGVHSVTAIAMRSGFTDVSSFTRAFRRWTGTLPSDYLAKSGKPTK